MAVVANLLVSISGDSTQLRKELAATKRQIKTAFGTEALKLSENLLKKVKLLTVGFVALGAASVKMAADMEQTKVSFTTLLGSADKADAMIKDLVNFAAKTPFDLKGLSSASRLMLAYGFDAKAVIPILRSVGDAASSLGGGTDTMESVIRALGQIQQKGKLSAEEMRQLAEQGIGAWQYVADAMGITIGEAQALAQKGAIGSGEAIRAIVNGMTGAFEGGMEAQSKTVLGMVSTIKDNAAAVMRTVGMDIMKGLNLQETLTEFSGWLTEFSTIAETSGVGEALRQLVPDNIKQGIVIVAGVITALLVPALYSAAIGALAAAAPLVAIGTIGAAVAYLLYENWEDVGPFFEGMWDGIMAAFDLGKKVVTLVVDIVSTLAQWIFGGWDNVAEFFAGLWEEVVAAFVWAYEKIVGIVDGVANAWNTLKAKMGFEVERIEVEVADIDTSELEKLKEEIKDTGAEARKQAADLEAALAAIKSGAVKDDGSSGKASKKAAKEYEKLSKAAQSTSKSIEQSWLEMNGAQGQILDNWYADQVAELEKSAKANANYQRDKIRLEETYQEKQRQLLNREAKERADTLKDITNSYRNMYDELSQMGLKGSSGELFNMEKAAQDDTKAASDYFSKLSADYVSATETQKQTILDGLAEVGAAYEITAQGSLDFSTELASYEAQRFMQLQDDKLDYYRQAKDVQADIDEAYNQNSFAMLREALTQENALRLNALESQREMMDTYQEAMLASMQTTADLAAGMYTGVFDGLSSSISGVLTGVTSIEDAFVALGETLLQVLADFIAQKVAGMLTVALMEEELLGTSIAGEIAKEEALAGVKSAAIAQQTSQALASTTAQQTAGVAAESALLSAGLTSLAAFTAASLASGAAVAAAWAAAAANVSLASFGANAGPAMAGISSTHALTKTLSIPQLASGGYATGSAIVEIGEGRHDEAVLPLSGRVFSQIADGINRASGGQEGQSTVNVYGDINGASDEDRIFSGLFGKTRAALMGG